MAISRPISMLEPIFFLGWTPSSPNTMKRTLDQLERELSRTVRQEQVRSIRGGKILLAKSRAKKQALLEKLLSHATQPADETWNRRQSQEHLARLRAEGDYIRRCLPGWPGEKSRKLSSEGSEGYKMQARLQELTKQSKE